MPKNVIETVLLEEKAPGGAAFPRASNFIEDMLHGRDSEQTPLPASCGLENVEAKMLSTPAGKLIYWYQPAQKGKPTIAYFQGRNRGLGHESIVERWKELSKLGYGVACFNPRNYGDSFQGNALGVMEDNNAFMKFLLNQKQIAKDQLYCMGNSRGSGHAAMMAQEYDCAGLVIQAGYTHPLDISPVSSQLKKYSLYPVNSISALMKYKKPVLILHGIEDLVIPFSHGVELAQAAGKSSATRFVIYQSHGHMDMPKKSVIEDVNTFIMHPPEMKCTVEVYSRNEQGCLLGDEKLSIKNSNDNQTQAYIEWCKGNILQPILKERDSCEEKNNVVARNNARIFDEAHKKINSIINRSIDNSPQKLHADVTAELKILSRSNINNSENKIKDFFKFLLGVAISIPTGFLAWCSSGYRNTFWNTKAQVTANKLVGVACDKEKQLRNPLFRV